ncbi:polysaccharide deacetylase family protein, partial [Halobium palmae]
MDRKVLGRRNFLAATGGAAVVGGSGVVGGMQAEGGSNGMLVFTYDDGPNQDYTKAYREAHGPEGVPACTGLVTKRLNYEWSLNPDQIRELVDDGGWEMMSHSRDHLALGVRDLVRDARAGDTRIYVDWRFTVGSIEKFVEVTDGTNVEEHRVAGAGDDDVGEYIDLAEPLEHDYAVADGAIQRQPAWRMREQTLGSIEDVRSEMGIELEHMIMPYGHYSAYTQRFTEEYFTSVANTGSHADWEIRGLNPVDRIELPNLSRRYFREDVMTESEIRRWLDELVERDVLGILGGHTSYETLPAERIRWTIQEAKARDVEIVTLTDALTRLGFMDEEASSPSPTPTPTSTTTPTTSATSTTSTSTTAPSTSKATTATSTTATSTTATSTATTATSTTATSTSTDAPTSSTTTEEDDEHEEEEGDDDSGGGGGGGGGGGSSGPGV